MKRNVCTKTWWGARVYQRRMFQVEGGPPKSPKIGVCLERWRHEKEAGVVGVGMNEQVGGGAQARRCLEGHWKGSGFYLKASGSP